MVRCGFAGGNQDAVVAIVKEWSYRAALEVAQLRDEVERLRAALLARRALDTHFAACFECDITPEGEVWYCDQWNRLHNEANRLTREALGRAEP